MNRIIEITDACDPRLRRYANLRFASNHGFDRELFVVEGRWCLQRLIESRQAIVSVLVERGKEKEVAGYLSPEIPLYSLPPHLIRKLVGFDFHRGVLACGRRPRLRDARELSFTPGTSTIALAVLGVSDEENLGSILRTAAALGINQVLIGPKTADPYSRRAIRVSMASVFRQQLFRLDAPEAQLKELEHRQQIRTVVTTLDTDGTPLNHFVRDDRHMILAVGNEAAGVPRSVQAIANDRVTIPMHPGTDSLNVSVAAAIFMYQLVQQS